MNAIRRPLRSVFAGLEAGLDRIFGPAWNPIGQMGALGYFLYWIVAVSGIYLYILFDTGVTGAFDSVERLTREQWYLGGVLRSLHRYASDGMVVAMVLHLLREFAFDRYRGVRWFSWLTGVPILWLVFAAGISGYWLVWDKLAQYVAIATTEWIDGVPIFGEPIARNFLAPDSLSDRFFTLLVFIHIVVPLFLLFVMWLHLQRISRPRVNPPRGLAAGTLLMLLALSLIAPATSQGRADLATVPAVVDLDWFYLGLYPLLDLWSAGKVWALAGGGTLALLLLPWLPPLRRAAAAAVDLDNCNGCSRCAEDCPYNAITMGPRTDGRAFTHQAVVDPCLCTACGICAGSCPTSTPFRRRGGLLPGIDLPEFTLRELRDRIDAAAARLSGARRIVLFGCERGADLRPLGGATVAPVGLPCIAMLPPSFIDYVLSRRLADGVFLSSCGAGECHHRLGPRWMDGRLAGTRDPRLRARVPRERIAKLWTVPVERARLRRALAAFAASLDTAAGRPAIEAPSPAESPHG